MKLKKKKRRKRRPEQIAFDKAWHWFSLYIRRKSNNCITCGKYIPFERRHAGHFKHGRLDFDEHNVHMQCNGCNTFRDGMLDVYAEQIIKRYGIEEFNDIIRRSHIIKKWSLAELQDIITKYKKKVEDLKDDVQIF